MEKSVFSKKQGITLMNERVTNPTLLQRMKNQYDDKSWDEFNTHYHPYIYIVSKGLGLSHHDAVELTQIVLLKVWKNIPKFNYRDHVGSFRGWLRRVIVNSFKNYVVTKAYKQESLDALEEKNDFACREAVVSESEIEQLAELEWENYICTIAWQNVKGKFSDKVKVVYEQLLQGFEPEKVADNTGVKRNTVYIYRKRVNEKLFIEIRRLNYELG